MNKVLYGILNISLLFYKNIRGELESNGFEINPYDHCVANKNIDIPLMKITWHVDDLKVPHMDAFEITKSGMWLEGTHRENMTVHSVKVHDYLVMDLHYLEKGSVKVSMIKCVNKFLTGFQKKLGDQRSVYHMIGCSK